MRIKVAQRPAHRLRQSLPYSLPRTSPDQSGLGKRMRNVRHCARVQLGHHSDGPFAHGRQAITQAADLTAGERLEFAPEGANMEVVELVSVSLLQRKQLR